MNPFALIEIADGHWVRVDRLWAIEQVDEDTTRVYISSTEWLVVKSPADLIVDRMQRAAEALA